MIKKVSFYFLFVLVFTKVMFLSTGCANIVAPTGGPRDSLPPVLISVTPEDSSLNFTGNRVTFVFNEFVDLQNVRENLIVSPTPKIDPIVDFKLRTVNVRIKDTLEPNTTYSYNFGNSIRDNNEGNQLRNFTYVFSTGSRLDEEQLTGNVVLAETGKVDTTLTVLLHRSADDSAIVKERPRFITRLDSSGRFNFRNLPPGTFYLYALKDDGGTRRYLSKTQLFAFHGRPVAVGDSNRPITLYAFAEPDDEPKKPAAAPTLRERNNQEKRLSFQTSLEGDQQDLLSSFEFRFPNPLRTFDSTAVKFTDYSFTPITAYSFSRDSTNKIVTLQHTWQPDSTYNLIIATNFAEDSSGRKILKPDTISFKAKKLTDYGQVRLRFPTLNLALNPVLQLVQSDKVVFSHAFTAKEFFAKLFKPGEYDIRILYDDNRNQMWDAGSFFGNHRQPEHVVSLPTKITIKGNWEFDKVFNF
jgi:hypothetical protein